MADARVAHNDTFSILADGGWIWIVRLHRLRIHRFMTLRLLPFCFGQIRFVFGLF